MVVLVVSVMTRGHRIVIVGGGASSKSPNPSRPNHCLNVLCDTIAKYSFGSSWKIAAEGKLSIFWANSFDLYKVITCI